MAVGPIHLQNLFLHAEQISKDIAHQAQVGYVQQDDAAEKLVQKSREDDARVHHVDQNEADGLAVNERGGGNGGGNGGSAESEAQQAPEQSASGPEAVREDYIGKQIDICQ